MQFCDFKGGKQFLGADVAGGLQKSENLLGNSFVEQIATDLVAVFFSV
jgi:hypothetical protein